MLLYASYEPFSLSVVLQMCKVLQDIAPEAVKAISSNQPSTHKLKTGLHPLKSICESVEQILQLNPSSLKQSASAPQQEETVSPSSPPKQGSSSSSEPPATEPVAAPTDVESASAGQRPSSSPGENDVVMEDADDTPNGEAGVIVLDD